MLRDRDERWVFALAQRDALYRYARSLGACQVDAEEAVGHAIEQAYLSSAVRESQLIAFLLVVVRRRCANAARARATVAERGARFTAAPEPDLADEVCDHAYAEWSVDQLASVPAAQRRVLLALASGRTVGDVARDIGRSYRAVESLASRGRKAFTAMSQRGLAVLVGRTADGWRRGCRLARRTGAPALPALPLALGLAVTVAPANPVLATPPPPRPQAASVVPAAAMSAASSRLLIAVPSIALPTLPEQRPAARGVRPRPSPPPSLELDGPVQLHGEREGNDETRLTSLAHCVHDLSSTPMPALTPPTPGQAASCGDR